MSDWKPGDEQDLRNIIRLLVSAHQGATSEAIATRAVVAWILDLPDERRRKLRLPHVEAKIREALVQSSAHTKAHTAQVLEALKSGQFQFAIEALRLYSSRQLDEWGEGSPEESKS